MNDIKVELIKDEKKAAENAEADREAAELKQ